MIGIRISEFCEQNSPFIGEIQIDESYFGAKRQKGKRDRGAYGKTPFFAVLQRGGKVYTMIVPNCVKATLQAIIRGKVYPNSIIHSEQWRDCNSLVAIGYEKHYRVKYDDEYVLMIRVILTA